MPTLVLLRHGQSLWNLQKRFTGWVDIDLTDEGEAEAVRAGELIKAADIALDRCFCSVLTRAIRTADLALAAADQLWIPLDKSWRLNERHYGGLTGRTHAEVAAEVGDEQVRAWRRSYDVPPPPLNPGGRYDFAADRRYAGEPIPSTESLKTTLERVLPHWDDVIAPRLLAGERLLVAAHGNSLRAIVKHLFNVPDDIITGIEIPTGNPLLVSLDGRLCPARASYLDGARAQALPAAALAGGSAR
ncbi:MAG TPA: 2,3-diphosphoglycerate-dependent phosphoglycerate mutase [Caulobacteraceae bacterium]|nr:2,3-diphosphoglycerate-dependent phosphoglycerate mutase [Caulobacteraceae bacterium]